MKPSLKVTSNGASLKIGTMLDRAESMRSFLNDNIYRIYQNAQRDRWMTVNNSQGKEWRALDPVYAVLKRKIYATYEGGGTKMLIATGRLYKSVIGPGQGQRKIVTNRSLYIATGVEYAGFVDEVRPFTTWGDPFRKKVSKAISDFVMYNIRRSE